ncbi:hypothetical protein GS3922_14395 [Geobacillus subterraneus]|uniref:Lipoprotein n=2 Tax=Geobacillus TaxID=129337 RepID=A0ABM6AED7_9BACL|nr:MULTISPECIES: hypothetical protein [Geobacillus]AMX84740.1 hypothetical protein GS3922_14395 [Geobacillus subterraneus]KZS25634.1 hypothetical protein A5418_02690 [Geobacillus subterraneus]OXB85565.1 hypothetical protein B9L21_14505 [Geobacillus uzenensis]QIZ66437.1 hypothetical protein HF500_03525 [Geobacillus subterraneus]
MRKRWAPLLILLLWLSGCSFGDIKPPELTLTINGETVDHRLGTYTWSTGRRGIVADAAAPPLLVRELKPHPTVSGAKLRIEFDYRPSTLEAGVWNDDDVDWQPVQHGTITLPKQQGSYIYVIHAAWQEGDAIYAFPINIR